MKAKPIYTCDMCGEVIEECMVQLSGSGWGFVGRCTPEFTERRAYDLHNKCWLRAVEVLGDGHMDMEVP